MERKNAHARALLTFDTTHHALWAEEIAGSEEIACEVVPAPPEAGARCDLALELLAEELEPLTAALRAAGVRFTTYRRG